MLAGNAAMALDSRSTASSAGIGKPGDIRSANHGSSRTTNCGDAGKASATSALSSTSRDRTVDVAWANASVDDIPPFISSTPSVTGPTNCHFTGSPSWRTRAARSRNDRNPVKPSPSSGSEAWAIIASCGES